MKLPIAIVAFFLIFSAFSAIAQKKQEPPARRLGLDPVGRTKVVNVVSRSYLRGDVRSSEKIERDVLNSNVINRNKDGCTVNVGTPAVIEGVQGIGSRYGTSHNDQVTVIRGSVINVCR